MKEYTVKDLMVPISEYATVSEDASLYEAVLTLEKAQADFNANHYTHRAILVYDKQKQIVGKLSQLDVIRSLEPKYNDMLESSGHSRFGFSRKFMKSLLTQYKLWDMPLADICRKASGIRVSDVMYTPSEGEFVSEEATLNEAVHMLVMGHHQSLLVTRGTEIIGILRLTDVFSAIFHMMKECNIT